MQKQFKIVIITLIASFIIISNLMASRTVEKSVIREVTQQELMKLITSGKDLVIQFHKPQCPYCVYISPILDRVAASQKDITFISVNAGANPTWYKKTFKFATVPTVVYYKNGSEKKRHGSNDGTITQKDIEAIISQIYGADSIKKI